MGPDAIILVFDCGVSSKLFPYPLSHSSRGSSVPFHFQLLEWYHLYLWLLVFLPVILIPACDSSSPVFRMVCFQFSSVTQSCPTFCNPMDCSMPGFPVHHQLPELTQTLVHKVSDAIQPSHPLSPTSPAFSLSQHQGLFQ